MADIDVKVSTSELRDLLDNSYSEVTAINESLVTVQEAFAFFGDSNVMEGKAAKGIKEFIEVVSSDVIRPSIEFNDKLFKSLKKIEHEFDQETFIDLG